MARILIVDDNMLVRALLAQVLRSAGYEVEEADNGLKAFALAKAHLPDVIVTDFYMPQMDGAELVKLIRAEKGPLKDVPVVGLAGTSDSERKLLEAGVNTYLAKPLREVALLDSVSNALSVQKK